jgi:DNA (cytosine-5)-methyltransferase 1
MVLHMTARTAPEPLTAVSLFAGIGGFDLALARAGAEVTASVEINPECRAVLARHFPKTTLFPDVSEVTVDQLRAAGFVPGRGVLAAGWPCQGNSVAGHRRGMDDPRSGLWRHVVRLLAEARPRWFLGENVPGLLGVNGGRDFARVIADLDDLGYGVAWRVLDAQWFGVPQRRRRVFLAGCLGDGTAPVQVLLEPEGGGWNPPQGHQTRPGTPADPGRRAGSTRGHAGSGVTPTLASGARPPGTNADDAGGLVVSTLQGGGRRGHRLDAEGAAGGHLVPVAPTLRTRSLPGSADPGPVVTVAHTVTAREAKGADSDATSGVIVTHTLTAEGADASEDGTGRGTPIVADPATAVRRLTPRECERLQGFPDDWTAGQSDAARYRQLGNAIAVPVAAWIAARLAAAEHGKRAA